MQPEWQPIETAPQNQFVLLYMPWTGLVRQGRFVNTKGRQVGWRVAFDSGRHTVLYGDPTHWMPLPEAPPIGNRRA